MKNQLMSLFAALILSCSLAHAGLDFLDDTGAAMKSNGGTLDLSSGQYAVGGLDSGGVYTYGPGPTFLPTGFGTFTQSVDIFVDPTAATGPLKWSLEVHLFGGDYLNSTTPNYSRYGEFDFFGYYEQDLTGNWVYSLGRSGNAPVIVDQAGWYTFSVSWMDDGTNASNLVSITDKATNITTYLGHSASYSDTNPWISSNDGYSTGYMWAFTRTGSETLAFDNISYQWTPANVPAPGALLLAGIGTALVGKVRRRM